MRHEPDGLPRRLLAETLLDRWDLEVETLIYAPLGFGSHHWIAMCTDGARRFVTADHLPSVAVQDGNGVEERFEGLRAAFESAYALRDAGLEFVLAPERTKSGSVLVRMANDWSLAVFPFVECTPLGPGAWEGIAEQVDAARLLARLHRALPPSTLRPWSAAIAYRDGLEAALSGTGAWQSGPFSEPARALVSEYQEPIQATLSQYDRLADRVLSLPEPWVVSHGEPHSANFLRSSTGQILLIDWDTVRLAPRERDLELGEGPAFEAHQTIASAPPLRPEVRELFRLRWSLGEIAVYVHLFRGEHGDSEDEAASWHNLQSEVGRLTDA